MKIQILGMEGCKKCSNLKEKVDEVVNEMNIDAEVEKLEDLEELTKRGIMNTPAIVIDDEVKSTGKDPDKEEIKKMIE